MSSRNESILKYLRPAFKQSNSLLHNVAAFVDDYKFLTNWDSAENDGWSLPATKEAHEWCGLWKTTGCLNEKAHEKLGKGRRIYVKQFQRSCYRSVCKVCYLKWIARQANKATRRIEEYSKQSNKKPLHLILCVPSSQYDLPIKLLRKRMVQIIKSAELDGAAVVFHPFRFNNKLRKWYYAPHFHLMCFGDKRKISSMYGKLGWFIKNMEERESVFQTFCYLLSHCGVKKGNHSLTWLGDLSYSKLKLENEPSNSVCPICGSKFVVIYYDGVHPVVPPDKPYEGLVDFEDWYEVKNVPKLEPYEIPSFEYAPTRDLNETLKGLILAN